MWVWHVHLHPLVVIVRYPVYYCIYLGLHSYLGLWYSLVRIFYPVWVTLYMGWSIPKVLLFLFIYF